MMIFEIKRISVMVPREWTDINWRFSNLANGLHGTDGLLGIHERVIGS